MIGTDRCYRCEKPLGELAQGILLMYPGHGGQPPLYTLPRMYCHECIQSFYKWAEREAGEGMKFRLYATDMACSGNDAEDLKKYLEMIDKAGEEGPAYLIENGKVYVNIFYGTDMAKLAEILREELIVTATGIEIYNGWRE